MIVIEYLKRNIPQTISNKMFIYVLEFKNTVLL